MIHVAIIDDDKNFCNEFKSRLLNINETFKTDCFYDIHSFVNSSEIYEIVFIDILLDKANGIDLASKIIEKSPSANIVFVSVEKDFFQDVYSAEHIYFLVKPISDKHLEKALELCLDSINKQNIYIKHKGSTIAINLSDTAYFEGTLKKTVVHYLDKSTAILNKSLSKIEDMLNNTAFIRVHQSYIINMNSITKFTKKKVCVLDKDISVSRKYSDNASRSINRFLGQKII